MGKQKSITSYLMEFAGNRRKYYVLSIVLAMLSSTCGILPFFMMSHMVIKLIDHSGDWPFYLLWCGLMALSWLGKCLFATLSTAISHKATFAVLGNTRKRVAEKLARVSLGDVKNISSGTLKNIMVERINGMETTLAHIIPEVLGNLIAPLICFIYLLVVDWRIALISLLSLVVGMLCFLGMTRGYDVNFKRTIDTTKTLNDTAVEYINGIEVIKAFSTTQKSYDKFVKAADDNAHSFIDWMRGCIAFFPVAHTVAPCTTLFVLPFSAMFYMNGSLSLSNLIISLILTIALIAPLMTVFSYFDDIFKSKQIIHEVTSVLEMKELPRPKESVLLPKHYDIELKDVSFSYQDKEVLHHLSMSFKENEVTALVGPSGSGKSTIAKLIASFFDVNSGSIEIGGVDLRNIDLETYNKMVAYVSQDTYLFNMTVMENIRLGNPDATNQDVIDIAKKSGCHEFIMSLEHGYETIVGSQGGHLSGGERQRISIARAMLKNAPIIILDEATAYTDPENESIIQSAITQLVKGKTLIVIAHRLSTIKNSDRIYVISDGSVVEEGKHDSLLKKKRLYRTMWDAHISVKEDRSHVE